MTNSPQSCSAESHDEPYATIVARLGAHWGRHGATIGEALMRLIACQPSGADVNLSGIDRDLIVYAMALTFHDAQAAGEADWCEMGSDGWLTLKHSSADNGDAIKFLKETASHITAGRYIDAKASLDEAYKALIVDCPRAAPTYGIIDPDYARIFTMSRCLAWAEGYALLFHGSFTRDLDLIAVPWTSAACEPEHLVKRIVAAADLRSLDEEPSAKEHGRLSWTLVFKTFGDPRFIDFSVAPRITDEPQAVRVSSADTEDELGLYDLGESFLAEYERATKGGCLKNFVCAESPVEVLWHLINEVDELRLEIDQLRQAAGETGRDAVAAIVLKAMQAKVDPDTYGASYAIKINADRAVIAADAILSLHRPEHNATNIT